MLFLFTKMAITFESATFGKRVLTLFVDKTTSYNPDIVSSCPRMSQILLLTTLIGKYRKKRSISYHTKMFISSLILALHIIFSLVFDLCLMFYSDHFEFLKSINYYQRTNNNNNKKE